MTPFLFDSIDANDNGYIDYSGCFLKSFFIKKMWVEFISVFLSHKIYENEKYIKMAFQKFDIVI